MVNWSKVLLDNVMHSVLTKGLNCAMSAAVLLTEDTLRGYRKPSACCGGGLTGRILWGSSNNLAYPEPVYPQTKNPLSKCYRVMPILMPTCGQGQCYGHLPHQRLHMQNSCSSARYRVQKIGQGPPYWPWNRDPHLSSRSPHLWKRLQNDCDHMVQNHPHFTSSQKHIQKESPATHYQH